MFRDTQSVEPATSFWQAPDRAAAVAHAPPGPAFGEDEIGAVWHVYREIARRIPRNAYTAHASSLGIASDPGARA